MAWSLCILKGSFNFKKKYLVEEDGLADVSPVLIEPLSEQKEYHEEDDEGEPARPREPHIDDPGHAEREDHSDQR